MVRKLLILIVIFSPLIFDVEASAKINKIEHESLPIRNGSILVESSITKNDPYLYEPIIYQVKLLTKIDLKEVKFENLRMDNVTVRPLGSYKVSDIKHKGLNFKMIELSYLITPLKEGKLIIPSQKLTGLALIVEKNNKSSNSNVTSIFENFDEEIVVNTRIENFTVMSNSMNLEVRSAIENVTPWLPAESISSEAIWDSTAYEVGKPIKLQIKINARGIAGRQIPSFKIEDLKGADYKIYSGKSESHDNTDKLSITSSKNESFTIVPLKPGQLSLPKVKINWWDVKNKKIICSEINIKAIQILPGDASSYDHPVESTDPGKNQFDSVDSINKFSYKINIKSNSVYRILILLFIITLIIIIIITLYKVIRRLSIFNLKHDKGSQLENTYSKKHNLTLYNVSSAKELHDFLQDYANSNWQTPVNSSLQVVFDTACLRNPKIQVSDYLLIIQRIEGALYANKEVDIVLLKKECKQILKLVNTKVSKIKSSKAAKLPELNPL